MQLVTEIIPRARWREDERDQEQWFERMRWEAIYGLWAHLTAQGMTEKPLGELLATFGVIEEKELEAARAAAAEDTDQGTAKNAQTEADAFEDRRRRRMGA